jgi:hypothetical protein
VFVLSMRLSDKARSKLSIPPLGGPNRSNLPLQRSQKDQLAKKKDLPSYIWHMPNRDMPNSGAFCALTALIAVHLRSYGTYSGACAALAVLTAVHLRH